MLIILVKRIWGQGVKTSYGQDGTKWVFILEINS